MARHRIHIPFRSLLVLGVSAVLVAGVAGPAFAVQRAATPAPWYLALGDSVAFGYTPPAVTRPQRYLDPNKFKGYPDYVNYFVGRLANASCPGETSSSLLDDTAQSNGCENSIGSDLGYRDAYPLHVKYTGNQIDYATNFLTTHTDTSLVTINIGANDIFVCQATTSDHCTGSDFQTTLQTIATNLSTMLTDLRNTGYAGKIIVMQYYAISYTDPIQVGGTKLLNQTLTSVAHSFSVDVANGYQAFKKASGKHGNPCAAGLLIKLPDGTCNIHPSQLGHSVLALAFANATAA